MPVPSTLISGYRSASKKSPDRRCWSRLPMPVRSDATWMSSRPKMAPLPVIWPSALTSVNRPSTLSRPQKFLILKPTLERSRSRVHTPAVSGSFSRLSTLIMAPLLSVQNRREIGRVEVLVDAIDQVVGIHGDHDADPQRDQSAVRSGGMQDVLLDEAAGKQPTVQHLVAALGGDADEPPQHLQGPDFVVVAFRSRPPHGDVVGEEVVESRLVTALDRREQHIGHVEAGFGSGHRVSPYSSW